MNMWDPMNDHTRTISDRVAVSCGQSLLHFLIDFSYIFIAELYVMWWNKRVPYKIKRTLFRGAVCGASLTGLTALLLHDRDYLRLQRCLEKKLRALMLGTAFWEGPEHTRTLSPSVEKGGGWRLLQSSSVYKGSDGTRALQESPHVMHIFYAVGLAE